MMESMKNRRTIRAYQNKDVPSALLNELLEVSLRASTTGNMQLYSIVVTRDEAKKEALAPAHFNQLALRTAPVVLTFCADFNRFEKWCKQRNAEPGYHNFQSFMNAFMDALIVAQTFCVAAEEAGLGICYLGSTTYNPQMIIDALQLPELVFPITTITLGYPEVVPPQVDRLQLAGIVHEEAYHDYSEADINRIYAQKEALPESQKFVAENNKETLAQVFTDVRYTQKDNEVISEKLFKALKQQGFLS